jgi:hypothetical protein
MILNTDEMKKLFLMRSEEEGIKSLIEINKEIIHENY